MTTPFVLIAVLAIALMPGAAAGQPPGAQVILDNPSVRVSVITLPPGGGTGRHQGIEAEVGIVVEGDLTVESPLGRQALRPGTAYWLPGLTPHDTRNEGQRPARMLEILLKRCD
ncbi:MAG TPA: cupin domain-containing protein [Methylomirabilota bacterium]|nr:cupin domain-containing protein [Methylomirabilota bacterium]